MGHEVFYVTAFSKIDVQDPNVMVLNSRKRSIAEKLRSNGTSRMHFTPESPNRIADAVQSLVLRRGIEVFQMEETHGWARTVIDRSKIPIVVQLSGPWFIHRDLSPTEKSKPENLSRIEREGKAILSAAGLRAQSASTLLLAERYYGPLKALTRVIPNPIRQKQKRTVGNSTPRPELHFVCWPFRLSQSEIFCRRPLQNSRASYQTSSGFCGS